MINLYEVAETNKMIEEENLDVRTSLWASAFWTVLIPIWRS